MKQITGRDLIMLILQYQLENKVYFTLLSEEELAVQFKVGVATVRTWETLGRINGWKIGGSLYFLKDTPDPRRKDEKEV